MKKVTTLVLMLCFILSGALCYAHGEARTENEKGEGIPIEVKECTGVSGSDRSNSINALGVTVMTDELNGNQGQKCLICVTCQMVFMCTPLAVVNMYRLVS